MRNTWLLAAVAAFAFAGPLCAQMGGDDGMDGEEMPDLFKNTDTDGDGKISLDEIKKLRLERTKALREAAFSDDYDKARSDAWEKYGAIVDLDEFLMCDMDDDNSLTRKEYEGAWEGEDYPKHSDKDFETLGDVYFDEMAADHDTDKDGKIGVEELVTSLKKQRDAAAEKAGEDAEKRKNVMQSYSVSRVLRDALTMDLDVDGTITREEARKYQKAYNEGDVDYLPKGKNLEILHKESVDEVLLVMDTDKDGNISREELAAIGEKPGDDEWKKLDKDGNGKLDQKEIIAAMFEKEGEEGPSEPEEAETPKEESGSKGSEK
ncbi:MAG: EF-hand domain-containing protein [Planctomycetota bacterium]